MGLSKACFAKVCASEELFLCPNCTVTKQANEITDLRNSIAALSQVENNLMSAVVKHSCTEPTGSRAGSRVSWAEVARGNSHGARHGGKHIYKGSSNNASGVPDNASVGRVSNIATGSDNGQNSSHPDTSPRAAKRSTNRNLIKVSEARRVWGTLKSCTVSTVKAAITQLCPQLPSGIRVRRKFKIRFSGGLLFMPLKLHVL